MMLLLAYPVKLWRRRVIAFGGMRPGMDRLELPDRDMGVAGRHGERGMAQDGLDIADIGPVLEQQRGHGVAEDVTAAGFPHATAGEVAAHLFTEPTGADRAPAGREEEDVRLGRHHELGPGLGAVAIDPGEGPVADRHHAIFAPLALPHEDDAALMIEIGEREAGALGAAEPRGVEGLQQGPVPQA